MTGSTTARPPSNSSAPASPPGSCALGFPISTPAVAGAKANGRFRQSGKVTRNARLRGAAFPDGSNPGGRVMHWPALRKPSFDLVAGILLVTACGGGESATAPSAPDLPANVAVVTGDRQAVPVGTAVLTPPTVRVTDHAGAPVPGAAVTFAVASGDGAATGASVTTNQAGLATVGSWTLGPTAGANSIEVTAKGVNGPPVIIDATGMGHN